MNQIIRRKVALGSRAEAGIQGAEQGWRLAFARAARDCTGLLVEVEALTLQRLTLEELLDLPPDRALLALLDGPQAGLGLMMLSPPVLAALIEMQTTGRVSSNTPLPRRPTRTDAAMVAATIDRALQELELLVQETGDLNWAGAFRYASFLEDPRPLGLLLEDQPYSVLTADLSLAEGARQGQLILALPAEGRLEVRPVEGALPPDTSAVPGFADAMAEAVQGVTCSLQAVIGRLTLPLQQVMALQEGELLALPEAALDRIRLETPEGRQLARARLGQNRGLRALRLIEEVAPAERSQPSRQGNAATGVAGRAEPKPTPPIAAATEAEGPMPPAEVDFPGFAAMDASDGLLATG